MGSSSAPASTAGRLLALGRRLAGRCPRELGEEVIVTGSAGAGLADEHSDLELVLLGDDVPAVEDVRDWLGSVGGEDVLAGAEPGGVWAWCRIGGIEVEPYWARTADAEAEVDAILAGEALEHPRLAFAHVLTHCVVLRGDVVPRLAERCTEYPEALAVRLLERALVGWQIPAASARLAGALRGDRVFVRGSLLDGTQNVLRCAFALNRRWEPPRWKWLARYAAELAVAPPDLVARVESTLGERDLVAAVRALNELILDTLVLVPPEIDAEPARRGTEARLAQLRR